MAEFEAQKKLEGWVEGGVSVLETYLATVIRMNVHPIRTALLLGSSDDPPGLSSPSMFLILSYVTMCFAIREVDFSDPFFSIDLAQRLDASGVLDAAKTIKVETLLVTIYPALVLLLSCVLIATATMRVAGDGIESSLVRRNYSYAIGSAFLLIGLTAGGYQYVVKPIAMLSWWGGLAIHVLTLLPIVSVILPLLALMHLGAGARKHPFARFIATMLPIVILMLLFKLTIGTVSLLDYTRLR